MTGAVRGAPPETRPAGLKRGRLGAIFKSQGTGGVAERLNAPVLKTGASGHVGSNPTPSVPSGGPIVDAGAGRRKRPRCGPAFSQDFAERAAADPPSPGARR